MGGGVLDRVKGSQFVEDKGRPAALFSSQPDPKACPNCFPQRGPQPGVQRTDGHQTTQQATISEYLLHSGVFEFSKEEVSMLLVPTLSPKGTDRAKIGARCVSQPGGPAPALELNFLSRETFLYISPANSECSQ